VKRIRIVALLAGLGTDLIGTIVFALVLSFFFVARHVHHGDSFELVLERLNSDVPFLVLGYFVGIAFTFIGAYVTARLSRPHSLLNTLIFGLVCTVTGFLFVTINPLWYTILCELTMLPVSLVPGYVVQRGTV